MGVRRAVLACAVLSVLASAPASADWQVRRTSNAPLLDGVLAALWRAPDDVALARRAAQLAGRHGAAALLMRLASHAEAPSTYAGHESYAQVLSVLGDARAAAEFEAALRESPGSAAALSGRARALAAAGDPGAAAAFRRALDRESRPAARRRLLEGALSLLPPDPRGADLDRAIELRRELARLAPGDRRAAEALADLLERAGRPDQAAAALQADHPGAPLPLVLRAARLRGGSPDPAMATRAAEALAELLRRVPARERDQRQRIWEAARDVARAQGTLAELAEQLARDPGPAEWHLLGEVREELGDLEGALEATRRAHALSPRDVGLGRRLVTLLDRTGRGAEARRVDEELLRRLPADAELAAELANRQWDAGDHAMAVETFDRALARFARQPTALQGLADLAGRWHDNPRAIRAWTLLARLQPASDVVVVGLGEAQFQAGDRAAARRTWAALRRRASSPAAGHLRLGEILLDHELTHEARDEAHASESLDPRAAAPHRLLARIAERQHDASGAISEWEKVLAAAGATSPDAGAARHEARSRLLALLAHEGRGRLEAKIRALREAVAARPDDVETALFLAEAEQRAGDLDGATNTLRAVAERRMAGTPGTGEAAVEAGFALARLLKRQGRLDDAQARLDELARALPGRAREAELQGAEIALARHDRRGALARAGAAAAGADPAALARIGEIREQAGDDDGAAEAYRAAQTAGDAPPTAPLALARILERRGDIEGAAATLEAMLSASHDDASVGDAARRTLSVDEMLGRLPALAESLARPQPDGASSPARRHALLDVLVRMPRPADPQARARWTRLGRLALRPLLDILAADSDVPDRRVIDLLGELGDGDAAPALARIADRALDRGTARDPRRPGFAAREAGLAALSALARLGDARGFDVLARAAEDPSPSLRRIGLWGLGRTGDPRTVKILLRALDEPQIDLQVLACLGLGGATGGRPSATLARIAQDPSRAHPVRRAAVAGLARTGGPQAVETLLALVDGADAELASDAALAAARTHDPRVPGALLARALVPGQHGAAGPSVALLGLAAWSEPAQPPAGEDQTPANDASVGAPATPELLAAAAPLPGHTDLFGIWRGRLPEIERLLGDALGAGGEARRAALRALDSRTDEPGLGELAPAGEEPIGPEAAQAAREIAAALADAVADALDAPEPAVRAAALSVLAKLADGRVSDLRLAAAVTDGDPDLADAAARAARLMMRALPGSGPGLTAAVAPLVRDDGRTVSWRTRLSAVRVLAELGPAGLDALRAAASDRNALVRAAAKAATGGARLPGV